MHKKLAADLTSLAHSILQMKNKDDVLALQKKAHEVYEKLSILAYVEEYIRTTPNAEFTKEELLEKIESAGAEVEEPIVESIPEPEVEEEIVVHTLEDAEDSNETIQEEVEKPVNEEETIEEVSTEIEDVIEEAAEEIEDVVEEVESVVEEVETEAEEAEKEIEKEVSDTVEEIEESVEEAAKEIEDTIEFITEDLFGNSEETKEEEKVASLDEELKDTISVDVVADLFENTPKKSLNDKLHGDIQIGLNDRIAFVKNLFGGSQEDFNRVVSQLNTIKTEKEAKKFINKMVKPDYDWSEKEEFEERFMAIVERKFA